MGTFFIWWIVVLFLGAAFMPLTSVFFKDFKDGGWFFSKVIAIMIPGFIVWVLGCAGLGFTSALCIIVTVFCLLANVVIYCYRIRKNKKVFWLTRENWKLLLFEEILFFGLFLLWTYLVGFRPGATCDTEKFMDYGFMASMMRSTSLPAPDIWESGSKINYYYGGQYYAVFLTKLTFTKVKETYNIMRTMVSAFGFVLPFSLVYQLWNDRMKKKPGIGKRAGILAGILAGSAVSFAGNMHYVLANFFDGIFNKFLGHDADYSYWFPNSTRYIGYYPEGNDKTIHEFPAYSFVLGDLHAHVVNLMFVFLFIALMYSFMTRSFVSIKEQRRMTTKEKVIYFFAQPQLLMAGLMLGIFHFTNYWDFAIYFVVAMAIVVYRSIREGKFKAKYAIVRSLCQGGWLFLLASICALPFTLTFKTMVSGIALAKNHTALKQYLVIWGYPLAISMIFIVWIILMAVKKREKCGWFKSLFSKIDVADLFAFGMALCAIGLILAPEIIYIRDIYEDSYARANTMFKLTYQAFVIFGICIAYIVMRFLFEKSRALWVVSICGLVCILSTSGYIVTAVTSWFGTNLTPLNYKGVDCTAYLEDDYPDDAGAINWLNENVTGSPVVLEAYGDSYSRYNRVSAMTGLPTVEGWYVHEWLWRNDITDLNQRRADIDTIYTSTDESQVRELLEKYNVSYIFIGSMERERYSDLNSSFLSGLGQIVYSVNNSDGTQTTIIKLADS